MSVPKTQLRVEVVSDGSAARTDLKATETQVGALATQFGGLQAKLTSLASSATGFDLSKLGGLAQGAIGTAGETAGGLAGGAGVAALVGPAAAATAGLGALVVAGKAATGSVIELAGETKKFARETGLSVETSSALLAVFKRFGVDAAGASKELGLFAKQMGGYELAADEGVAGGKKFADTMKALGVDFHDAQGNLLPMDQTLLLVADKFKAMPDGVEKTALAMQLFGKGGKDMIPILNQGSEGIKGWMEDAKNLGLTLTGDNMDAVKGYTLAHKALGEAFEGLKVQVGTLLMPALAELAKTGVSFAQDLNRTVVPAIQNEDSALHQLLSTIGLVGDALTDANRTFDTFANRAGKGILQFLHDLPNDRAADDPVEQWFQQQFKRYDESAAQMAQQAKAGSQKVATAAADGLNDPAAQAQAQGYGSDLLAAYLKGMNPEGLTIFDEIKKTVEDALKQGSPDGKVDEQRLRDLAPLIAKVADEVARTGQVSDATWTALNAQLGGEGQQVQELIADYEQLKTAKDQVAAATEHLKSAEATLKQDTKDAAGEAAGWAAQIKTARDNQAQADKAEAANLKGLQAAYKELGEEQKASAAAGAAALVPLNQAMKQAQEDGRAVADGYRAQNDELQRQIDLNNQIVGQLEHQRDVKFLEIDERLAALRGSRNKDDLREAAELRRQRAQIERDSKPQIDLERERAQVANYGLQQQQKGIQDAAKQAADANAAQIAGIQKQIDAQTEANRVAAEGWQKRLDAQQQLIDQATTDAQTRHDADQERIDQLQVLADNSAAYWAKRKEADQRAVDDAQAQVTYWQQQETAANNTLTATKQIIAELAAANLAGKLPIYLQPTAGGTEGDNPNGDGLGGPGTVPQVAGGARDAHEDGSAASGNQLIGVGPGGGAGRGGLTEMSAPLTQNINLYGVGEAQLIDRITAAVQRVGAA